MANSSAFAVVVSHAGTSLASRWRRRRSTTKSRVMRSSAGISAAEIAGSSGM